MTTETITMDWPFDFHADGSIADKLTGALVSPPDGISDEAFDALASIDSRCALRYIGGKPNQCTPAMSEHVEALIRSGLVTTTHPKAWRRIDQLGLTEAGQVALAHIGERG